MTVRYQLHVDCDGAGCDAWRATPVLPGAPDPADEQSAREFVAVAGWTRKHVNDQDGDYCPECSRFLTNIPNLPAVDRRTVAVDADADEPSPSEHLTQPLRAQDLTPHIEALNAHAGFLADMWRGVDADVPAPPAQSREEG